MINKMPLESLHTNGLAGPFALSSVPKAHITAVFNSYAAAHRPRMKDAYLHDGLIQAICQDSAVLQAVAAAGIPDGVVWRSNMFYKAPTGINGAIPVEIVWHHDTHFGNGDEDIDFTALDHVSILVALRDIDEHSGMLQYIPGSHVDVDLHSSLPDGNRPFHLKPLERHFYKLLPEVEKRAVNLPIPEGHFAVFHSSLIHRSLPVPANGRARMSLAFRFARSPERLNVPLLYYPLLALPFNQNNVS